jgi:hypothetical protein
MKAKTKERINLKPINMKNLLKFPAVLIIAATVFTSCGGSDDEYEEEKGPDNIFGAISNMKKMGEEMEEKAKKQKDKIEERKAKGDTLAMHYEELMKYLPESIDGYEKKEPTGESINMVGASYSTARVQYTNGNKWIKVQIADYNQAYSMYQGLTAMWAMGISVDNPNEKSNGIKLSDDIAGWESFKKKANEANISLGVGSRFFVTVSANEQTNTDFVKEIAKSMKLKELAEL